MRLASLAPSHPSIMSLWLSLVLPRSMCQMSQTIETTGICRVLPDVCAVAKMHVIESEKEDSELLKRVVIR